MLRHIARSLTCTQTRRGRAERVTFFTLIIRDAIGLANGLALVFLVLWIFLEILVHVVEATYVDAEQMNDESWMMVPH